MNSRNNRNYQSDRVAHSAPAGLLETLALQEHQRLIESLRQVNLMRMANRTHIPPLPGPGLPGPPFAPVAAGTEFMPSLNIETTRQYLSQLLQPMPYIIPPQHVQPATQFPTPFLTPINTALQPVAGKFFILNNVYN